MKQGRKTKKKYKG